jgi:murein DD-endopeptidase MepM/ murein hydrolase activator NlpD
LVAGKHYTLMLVPEGVQSKVRRWRVSFHMTVLLGFLGLGAFMVAAMFVVHYTYELDQIFAAIALREENHKLKERLTLLSARVDDVDARLAELRDFDEKLRSLTDLRDASRGLAMGPLKSSAGGADNVDFGAFAVPLQGDDPAVQQLRDALLDSRLAGLTQEAARQMGSLAELVDHFSERELLLKSTPSIAPAHGLLTSGFGAREDPFTGSYTMHAGLDIAGKEGIEVFAPADGVVVFAGEKSEYGNCVVLDHGRDLTTLYGHLQRYIVKVGDKVTRGQHIAHLGNSGRSTGPHLHYEVRIHGVPVNPRRYVMH